jgi:UDP-N-acetylmuramoylalanine--D-glutamate ligase
MVELDTGGHAVVMGLGRFGGGSGAATFLLARGMHVTVTDLADPRSLEDAITQLRSASGNDRLNFRLGEHDESDFTSAQLVIANPAVPHPWSNHYLEAARAADVPVKTEIELTLDRVEQRKIIGVTGTAGKSTTCAMIDHLLRETGMRSVLGGNIGGSLLDSAQEDLDDADAVVLEFSSFMLHWIKSGETEFSPAVAVLTSLDSNHLDWHGNIEHYLESKRHLRDSIQSGTFIAPMFGDDIAGGLEATGGDPPWWAPANDDPWLASGERDRLLSMLKLSIPGDHQKRNALAALRAVATYLEARPELRCEYAIKLAPLLESFNGLPHRLCPVGKMGGILVVDDSKSTTPAATIRAVDAFEDSSRVHLVAGGFDKGIDLSKLSALGDVIGGLYAVGETGTGISSGRHAHDCGTIDEAVRLASKQMSAGDVLLLSPGCASWDQFDNYERRGEAFLAAARQCLPGS